MPPLGSGVTEAPRAIIFDIGRVIISVDMAQLHRSLTTRISASHEKALHELESDSRWRDWQEGRITPREWHEHITGKFGLPVSFEEFCAMWCSVLDSKTILPERLFARLGRSCRLALLSNTDPIHVAHMEATFPFIRHFPTRIYSCHVGVTKPSPLIYHHTLREVDALPEEAMFIDDIRENAVAAQSLGINAFHFTAAEDLLAEFTRLGLWAPSAESSQ